MTRHKYAPNRQNGNLDEGNSNSRGNFESSRDRKEYMFPPIPAFQLIPTRYNSFKEIPGYNF